RRAPEVPPTAPMILTKSRPYLDPPSDAGRRRSGGCALGLCGPRGACEHRSGIAVQDLLARFLADLRFHERLSRPVTAELGAVGAAHDALRAVQAHGRLDRARAERVAIHVDPRSPEARRRQFLIRRVEEGAVVHTLD